MKNSFPVAGVVAILIGLNGLVGCTTAGRTIASVDRKAIQTRVYEGIAPQSVFRSLRDLLLAEGHRVRREELNKGILEFVLAEPKQPGLMLWRRWRQYQSQNSFEELSLHAKLSALGREKTEVRFSLQKISSSRVAGIGGVEVVEDTTYRELFNALAQKLRQSRD